MQISSIGFWESWRRSQSINRKRVWAQMRGFLSGLLPWQQKLRAIEGKKDVHHDLFCTCWLLVYCITMTKWFHPHWSVPGRFGVGVKSYFVFLRYLVYLNFLHCALISGFILGPTAFYGRSNSSGESAVMTDYSKLSTTQCQKNCCVCSLWFYRTFEVWRQWLCFGFLPGIGMGLFICACALYVFLCVSYNLNSLSCLQGYLDRSPVFYGFYTRGSLNLMCLNTPLLYLAGVLIILFISLIMVVRRSVKLLNNKKLQKLFFLHLKDSFCIKSVNFSDRTTVGYKHTWMLGKRYSMNVSYKIFCGWDFTIQDPAAATLKHSFIRNDLKVSGRRHDTCRYHNTPLIYCGHWANAGKIDCKQ